MIKSVQEVNHVSALSSPNNPLFITVIFPVKWHREWISKQDIDIFERVAKVLLNQPFDFLGIVIGFSTNYISGLLPCSLLLFAEGCKRLIKIVFLICRFKNQIISTVDWSGMPNTQYIRIVSESFEHLIDLILPSEVPKHKVSQRNLSCNN